MSELIAGTFRPMKTLRAVDDSHCPEVFAAEWRGRIGVVVDISHESPVDDPEKLREGGIEYRKLPSVSKVPPTAEEVRAFVELVDGLRADLRSSSSEKIRGDLPCRWRS